MKRNNIFMWAYITFIGISIILRIFLNYTIWNPIVFAITISSMFFAFEDLFYLLYQTQKKSCDITEKFVMESKSKQEKVLSFFVNVEEKSIEYKDTKYDLSELKETSQPCKKDAENLLGLINVLEEINDADRKKEKRLKKVSYIFAYIGFLLLFVSLIVSTLVVVSPLLQEIITVLSFAIILVTQQINNIAIEKIERENKQAKELLDKLAVQSDAWFKLKDGFDEFIERVENKLNTEVTEDAN